MGAHLIMDFLPQSLGTSVPGNRPLPIAAGFLGVPIHPLSMDETLTIIIQAIRDRSPLQHVALNVAKFVNMRSNPELRADVFGADLVGVDGMGIVFGARMLGVPVPERVAGVELMERTLALCEQHGYRPYFLGARPEVLERAMMRIRERHPLLVIAGSRHGYFKPEQGDVVAASIRAADPDCLFVGMPTPQKERFMARHRIATGVPFVMGVGGGIDILAGHVRRAPLIVQRTGFEWLYRTIQEPRRMWRRYLETNVVFAIVMARALMSRARAELF